MNRKEFLYRSGCLVCLAGMTGLAGTLASCGSSVKPYLTVDKKIRDIELPFSAWDGGNLVIVARKGTHDILVSKNGSEYKAVQMRCTHQGAGLKIRDNALYCGLHGSRFDVSGKVLEGPAKEHLTTYDVQVQEGKVKILIREIT